ncbi:RHS repeat-associated core domain-containing protein [Pseudomonas sp.]|uniref:RHS repeat-associated core domain-containing protein n=1 Tax=Pseudomonas sp. TaxID=306 RepID=UPI003917CB5A
MTSDHLSSSALQLQDRVLKYTCYGSDSVTGRRPSYMRFNGERKETWANCYFLGQGYRLYSAELMRFNSPDSDSPFASGGLNAYAYCAGDPVNYRDPDGHMPSRLPGRSPRQLSRSLPPSGSVTPSRARTRSLSPSPQPGLQERGAGANPSLGGSVGSSPPSSLGSNASSSNSELQGSPETPGTPPRAEHLHVAIDGRNNPVPPEVLRARLEMLVAGQGHRVQPGSLPNTPRLVMPEVREPTPVSR